MLFFVSELSPKRLQQRPLLRFVDDPVPILEVRKCRTAV